MLCRIYKKKLSAQRAAAVSSVLSKDHSTSSSLTQYDDVIDSLPEIDDRSFSLPKINSLKNLQEEEQKPNLQHLGSGNFDLATLAGLNPLPEVGQPHASFRNDIYAPMGDQFLVRYPNQCGGFGFMQ